MRFSHLFIQKPGLLALALLPLFLIVTGFRAALAQERSAHEMHAGMSMPMDEAADAETKAKFLADKRESEFNHHVAGFFVVLAGLFILAEKNVRERWPWTRFAWPACFVLSGVFVLVWS